MCHICQGRREEELFHTTAGESGHITSHHSVKGRPITCGVTALLTGGAVHLESYTSACVSMRQHT